MIEVVLHAALVHVDVVCSLPFNHLCHVDEDVFAKVQFVTAGLSECVHGMDSTFCVRSFRSGLITPFLNVGLAVFANRQSLSSCSSPHPPAHTHYCVLLSLVGV